ncbi:MAG TPA: FG-GAP-like repeat-containing protein, partial [Edaphobacter sp.]|nr:FG-GAP-like repeat-containing protein [Edaphobacter sp.]
LAGTPTGAIILLGKGDLSFPTSIQLPLPAPTVLGTAYTAIADINNDQKPDVVVADSASNTLSIFLNDGTGTFPQTAPDFTADLPQFVGQLQTADFNGDGLPDIIVTNYQNQNVSIYFSQTAPTLSLTSSASSTFTGSSVSLTVSATSASKVPPTGTINLMDGATSLGQQALDASGTTTFSLSNLSVGQHSLTATYSGDTNFIPATSPALTQSVNDIQVALPAASQTITAGSTATYQLALTPTPGLTGSITITCSQLPSLATCDPLTLPINGQPATATLTVHTTAPVTRTSSTIHAAAFGLLSITLLPFCRRRSLRVLAITVALSATLFTAGCSGGSPSSSTKPPTVVSPGTPQGSTQFTITTAITLGGQTLTRTSLATLVVQ